MKGPICSKTQKTKQNHENRNKWIRNHQKFILSIEDYVIVSSNTATNTI